MTLALLDNVCVTLKTRLTNSATILPVSPADAVKLCEALGANHSYLTMATPTGVEIVKVQCNSGTVVLTRAQGGTSAQTGPIGTCLCFKINSLVLSEFVDPPEYCQPTFITDTPDYIEITAPIAGSCEWKINLKQEFIDRFEACCPEDTCSNCTVADGVYQNATITIINGKVCGLSNGTNIIYQSGGCCGCGN